MPGHDGAARISALMANLRSDPPKQLGGQAVETIGDLVSQTLRDLGGKVIGRYDLPESDVLIFKLVDGTKVIARPSGTEPKIKFYILARDSQSDLEKAREATTAKINAISTDLAVRAEAA